MKKKQSKASKTTQEFEEAVTKKSLHYVLRLYVTGMSPRSQDAIANVRALCDKYLEGRYELEVIDIYQHPKAASENQIFAAPTLTRRLPLPIRKFVGDMTKTEKVLAGLDLKIEEKKD